jgi:hypothetical protein
MVFAGREANRRGPGPAGDGVSAGFDRHPGARPCGSEPADEAGIFDGFPLFWGASRV